MVYHGNHAYDLLSVHVTTCIKHTHTYMSRNPVGRTGMIGRGLLGRWGPNHAVDPIVTRWKRGPDGSKVMVEGKPVLEFVAILRNDTRDWAIPGVSL